MNGKYLQGRTTRIILKRAEMMEVKTDSRGDNFGLKLSKSSKNGKDRIPQSKIINVN